MAYPQPPSGNEWWGQPQQPAPGVYPPMYPPPRPTNSMAIAALVSALVLAPLGIVLGHIALSQIRRSGEEGRGLAMAGLVIGYVSVGLILLVLLFGLVMAVWVTNEVDKLPSTTTPTFGTYSMHSTAWTEITSVPTRR